MMELKRKITIYKKARKIYLSNSLSWKEKYDLIFSDGISRQICFDWFDPDCDYEDDVRAYMSGFAEYINKEKRLKTAKHK